MITRDSKCLEKIRYAAIGDSYTLGEGVPPEDSWPAQLTRHLAADGFRIRMVANPSVTGWTSQDALEKELSIYELARPTFATVLIGVNDWVQGVELGTFRERFAVLLDKMLITLPERDRLIAVTIPDFSSAPASAQYSHGRDISSGIAEYNETIKEQAAHRKLRVVDVYPTSQGMRNEPSLVAPDGLHPSAEEYALWEKLIYPAAFDVLARR